MPPAWSVSARRGVFHSPDESTLKVICEVMTVFSVKFSTTERLTQVNEQQKHLMSEYRSLNEKRETMLTRAEGIAAQGENMSQKDSAILAGLVTELKNIDARLTQVEEQMGMQQDSTRGGLDHISELAYRNQKVVRPAQASAFISDPKRSPDTVLRSWLRLGTEVETADDARTVAQAGATREIISTRAGLVSNATSGSYAVPVTLLREFETLLTSYCQFLGFCRVFRTTSGEDLKIAVDADQRSANKSGAWIAQASADSDKDITLEQRILKAHTATSSIAKFSYELMEDTGIDLSRMVSEALATRIGRTLSEAFTTGDGSSKPTGYLNDPNVTGITTYDTTAVGSIAVDDLIGLFSKLDPAHQASPNCRWIMSPATYAMLCKLKDSTGNSYLLDSLANPASPSILGKPIVLNPHHEDFATGKIGVVVGDFSQFAIRQVGDVVIQKSMERYFEYRQVGFRALLRVDANLLDKTAFAGLKGKA
jgi:HK97 family phage major capsid protein